MIAMMRKRALRLLMAALCSYHAATAFVIPASITTTTPTTPRDLVPPLRVAVDTSEIKK
jgi:hypothetical protein